MSVDVAKAITDIRATLDWMARTKKTSGLGYSTVQVEKTNAYAAYKDLGAAAWPGPEPSPTPPRIGWFALTSAVYKPYPATAAIDPTSPIWRSQLLASSAVNSIWTNSTDWTTTIVLVPAGAQKAAIKLEVPFVNPDGSRTSTPPVPWLPGLKVSGGDEHAGLIDLATMLGYEFEVLDPVHLTAHSMETLDLGPNGTGMENINAVADLSPFFGLIVPADLNAPLAHNLRCNVPNLDQSFVPPAIRSDGVTKGGIPSGKAWRFKAGTPKPGDPYGDWLVEGLSPGRQVVFVGDQGGSLAVFAQSTEDGTTSYRWPITGLDKSYVNYIEFLA